MLPCEHHLLPLLDVVGAFPAQFRIKGQKFIPVHSRLGEGLDHEPQQLFS